MANTTVGAYILAMIEVYGVKVNISDVEPGGVFDMKPGERSSSQANLTDAGTLESVSVKYLSADIELDGAKFNGATILTHELFHSVDFISAGTGNINYLDPINQNHPLFGNKMYFEVRAVMIENQFRAQTNADPRYYYGGVDLTKYLDYTNWKGGSWK